MSDCFGPEAGGVPDRPASPTTANDLWATGESVCGAGDGSYILGLINSIIANLRNICRAAAGQTLINDDPCDNVIVNAIRQLPCTQTPATAAQIDALKAMPEDSTVLVCIDGDVVAVPGDCFIDPVLPCPPASDFTISPDGATATYIGTEANVVFYYNDTFGNSSAGANGFCLAVSNGDVFTLSHANFDFTAPGSLEVGVNGTFYSGAPPNPPGSTAQTGFAEGFDAATLRLDGTCPGIQLVTTQAGKGQCISTGVFNYA